MSDDKFVYTYTHPGDDSSGRGALGEIAARFGTSEGTIRDLSQGADWLSRTAEGVFLTMGGGLRDGDELTVPSQGAEWSLPEGAVWAPWHFDVGDTLQVVMDDLAEGTPIGRLVPAHNDLGGTPSVSVAAEPLISTLSMIWYYHRNAPLRRTTLRSTRTNVETFTLFPTLTLDSSPSAGRTIWVPVFPPRTTTVRLAPSFVSDPKTGATVEVQPDNEFSLLIEALASLETQLDGIDMNRATMVATMRQGEGILRAFADLRESMRSRVEQWDTASRAAAMNHMPDPDTSDARAARAVALQNMDALIAAATDGIEAKAGWREVLKKNAKDAQTPNEKDIALAAETVRSMVERADWIALAADLCPTMQNAPLRNRKGERVILLEQLCLLAARAAVVLANSTPEHLAFVRDVADQYSDDKRPGPGFTNLIGYACAWTNGFDTPDGVAFPATTAPHQCFSVLFSIFLLEHVETVADGVTVTGNRISATDKVRSYARKAVGFALKKVSPLLIAAGIMKAGDPVPSQGLVEKLIALWTLYQGKGTVQGLAAKSIKLAGATEGDLAPFLGGLLLPLRAQRPSRFAQYIPEGFGGFVMILSTLWDVSVAASSEVDASTKLGQETSSKVLDVVATTRAGSDATVAIIKGAKALGLFGKSVTGEPLAVGLGAFADTAVAFLGRVSFLLGAVSESVAVYQAEQDGDWVNATGHFLGAAGYVCFWVASATGGAPVVVVVGVGLFLGSVAMTKGDVIVEIFEGDTVEKFKAISVTAKDDPNRTHAARHELADNVAKWTRAAKFEPPFNVFVGAFAAANFTSASAMRGALASAPPSAVLGN
jgi:hypothetical protein